MKRKDESASFGVIGLGRFGLALVESLSSAEREVIAIDRDESRVREARKFTDLAMVVDSLDMESLEETGVQNCDTVIICIAEKVDISVSHVSNLENGNTEPSLETLVEICNALRVTADHLLCDSLDAATEPYYEEVLDIFKGCSKREVQELTALLKCIRPHLYKL